ncbi:MAG: hypothetical protein GH155_05935 [Spirochaeta sp.]|nr:hypothetical protein [Spirochaeta sp.]
MAKGIFTGGPALIVLILLINLSFSACTNLEVKKPAGFAETARATEYRAISPEGILYRVRSVENYPAKDLEFWSKALKNQLAKEGYLLTADGEEFTAGNRRGVLYEWGVRFGNEDFIYLTAIIVFDNRITIAEAGGEHTIYAKYRQPILESLKSITLN